MWRTTRRDLLCLLRILALPAMIFSGVMCLVCNYFYRSTERPILFIAAWICMIVFSLLAALYAFARSKSNPNSDVRDFTRQIVRDIVFSAMIAVICLLLLLRLL